jgi:tetratricopeptide (TPR) repeat protein
MTFQTRAESLSVVSTTASDVSHVIGRHRFRPGSVVFVAVLVLRIFVLSRLSASPFLLPSGGDMHFYNDWAQRILHGGSSDRLAFYGLPGYAYLLALLYQVFGYNPFLPGVFQALLDCGTAFLIYDITLRLISGHAGFTASTTARGPKRFIFSHHRETAAGLAAVAWGFFVPAQTYAAILMPTTWLVFFFWFVVWRIIRKDTAPGFLECLFLGLLIGLMATAVATILFLIVLLLVAIFVKPTAGRQKLAVLTGAAILLAGVIAGTSPCWVHNYLIARDPVFLSAHSGINFWVGNNPDANGYPRFPPGLHTGQAAMLEDSIKAAESAARRPLKRGEVSRYWSAKAKNYMTHHPLEWLRLVSLKLWNICNGFQYDDLSIITSLRENGVTLPGLYFGIVAAFALPGAILAWSASPKAHWVLAAILLHIVALLTVFVTERYRLTIVPGLLIFAAFGLVLFWESLIARRFAQSGLYLFLLATATILTSWPQRNPALWALDAYNSGWQALETGNLSSAEEKLLLAHAYVPSNPETNFALGNLKWAQGNQDSANSFYLATLQLDNNHRGALNNLGLMALNSGQYESAEEWFRRAEKVEPRNPKTHFLLARTLLAKRSYEGAQAEIDVAIALNPDQTEFKDLRKKIVAATGRP